METRTILRRLARSIHAPMDAVRMMARMLRSRAYIEMRRSLFGNIAATKYTTAASNRREFHVDRKCEV